MKVRRLNVPGAEILTLGRVGPYGINVGDDNKVIVSLFPKNATGGLRQVPQHAEDG